MKDSCSPRLSWLQLQRTDSGREPSELGLSLMSEKMKGNNNTNVGRDDRGTAVLETMQCLQLFFPFAIVLCNGLCHLLPPFVVVTLVRLAFSDDDVMSWDLLMILVNLTLRVSSGQVPRISGTREARRTPAHPPPPHWHPVPWAAAFLTQCWMEACARQPSAAQREVSSATTRESERDSSSLHDVPPP